MMTVTKGTPILDVPSEDLEEPLSSIIRLLRGTSWHGVAEFDSVTAQDTVENIKLIIKQGETSDDTA